MSVPRAPCPMCPCARALTHVHVPCARAPVCLRAHKCPRVCVWWVTVWFTLLQASPDAPHHHTVSAPFSSAFLVSLLTQNVMSTGLEIFPKLSDARTRSHTCARTPTRKTQRGGVVANLYRHAVHVSLRLGSKTNCHAVRWCVGTLVCGHRPS